MIHKLKAILPLIGATCLVFPGIATADQGSDFLCDATQASDNELPMLAKSCPIGDGLWGRKPSKQEGLFWIQCGVFNQPLALAKAKTLYDQISSDVWMKQENKGYRCLIGPYKMHSEAVKDLAAVKKQSAYKQSFIREVDGKAETSCTEKSRQGDNKNQRRSLLQRLNLSQSLALNLWLSQFLHLQ